MILLLMHLVLASKQAGVKKFIPADFVDNLRLEEDDFLECFVFLDKLNCQLNYYGDLEARFDLTALDDVARYTASAALDQISTTQCSKSVSIK
jgi:hypothetical protein